MVWPDSSDPRRVHDEPLPSEAAQSRQRIIGQPLLRDSRISLGGLDYSPAEVEISRILEQILEQVLLATSATAAAIALRDGDGMVCRASVGPNAPDIGVRLDISSGLSGACVRTAEIQYCADTESDPRANAAASRRLQVRSVLVVPIMDGAELLGIFEIFSPHLAAFGNRDLQNLETLSRVVLENLREYALASAPLPAVDDLFVSPPVMPEPVSEPTPAPFAPTVTAAPAPVACVPAAAEYAPAAKFSLDETDEPLFSFIDAQAIGSPVIEPAPVEAPPPAGWPVIRAETPMFSASFPERRRPKKKRHEWTTSLLTAAVITVAVVLGWTVGRPSWQRATASRRSASDRPYDFGEADRNRDGEHNGNSGADRGRVSDSSASRGEEAKSEGKQNDDGLVVFQHGKVVFRQARPQARGTESAAFTATQPGIDSTERGPAIFISPEMASARLIQRIEPIYPETALQAHIQGEVELEAVIGKDGLVQQLKLVSGDALLAEAAADAVRQWKFRPYQSDGQPAAFSTHVSVDFRLP